MQASEQRKAITKRLPDIAGSFAVLVLALVGDLKRVVSLVVWGALFVGILLHTVQQRSAIDLHITKKQIRITLKRTVVDLLSGWVT